MRFLLYVPLLLAGSAQAERPERTVINFDDDHGISVLHAGETPVVGSGRRVTQPRPAGEFTRVIADDAMDVEIRIGPRAAIEVEGDDNLVERIRTDAEGGVLHLEVDGGYRVRRPMLARITVPRLERVELDASGDARIGGLDGGRLFLVGRGSGAFDVDGAVDAVELRIQGSGDADLDGLRAREANIVINGSGNARAHVTDALVANVNGTGDIVYRGAPRSVVEDVNGTGRIRGER
jgi:hypothetical protein